jgi:hypothetical protein
VEHYINNLYNTLDGVDIKANQEYFCGVNTYKAIPICSRGSHELFKLGREYLLQIKCGGLVIHRVVKPHFDHYGEMLSYEIVNMNEDIE